MKPFRVIVACLMALPLASASDQEGLAVLATLPECAAKCLLTLTMKSTCELEDTQCLCDNAPLQQDVETCILATCTIKEALFTKNATLSLCHAPVRDRISSYVVLSNVVGVLSGVFCLVRFAAKFLCKVSLGMDDLFILVTILAAIPCMVIPPYGLAPNGLGTDIWTLTPTQITNLGHYFYILEILYFLVQVPLKLSFLFFYLEIFPSKRVQRALWVTVGLTAAFGFTFIIVTIFQCRPISYFWTKWDMEPSGTCLSIGGIVLSSSIINIALDLWILAIPLSQMNKTNLDWRKSVGIGVMFSIGIFVTVASILRLYTSIIAGTDKNNNVSWEYLELCKWSTIEHNVGIWCACLPAIRVLLIRLFPRMLDTSKRYLIRGSHVGNKCGANDASSVNDNKSRPQSEPPGRNAQPRTRVDPIGITCDRTPEANYDEQDETHLVHMKTIGHKNKTYPTRPEDSVQY
ncbi:integral membrane protein PTH11 [Fusarium heterosporum]|uniref:Integral membrane protein PTH11 n=1 Tax=Fusarium heterosporum TaxID=42747 RepID=A0A8H5SVA5_FUSHE|nr:integral membrane protein PTH11 [Fusarium heterosporum]